jgi:SAM-dependent methyltransferase
MNRTIESTRDWRTYWNTVGQRHARDALFSQVERTVAGKPIPFEQIRLLADALRDALGIAGSDLVLDLCCGNGLVTVQLAPFCRSLVAVDYSSALIDVAREHHAAPNIAYVNMAAEELTAAQFPAGPPTKVCMNQGIQHFTEAMLVKVLEAVTRITGGRAPFYITDVPDADRIFAFYNSPERRAEFERRRAAGTEAIGTWWSRPHLGSVLASAGYAVRFIEPDPRRFTAHYRFDVLAHPCDPAG